MTVGSVLWGVSEERASLEKALLGSGLGIAACLLLNLPFPLPEPSTTRPVLVTIEYKIDPDRAQEFLEAIHKYQRIRRRDDTTRWGVYLTPNLSGSMSRPSLSILAPNTSGHTIALHLPIEPLKITTQSC